MAAWIVLAAAGCGGAVGARTPAMFVRDASIQGNELVTTRCSVVTTTEMRGCFESRSAVPVMVLEKEVAPKLMRPRAEPFAKQLATAREGLTTCARDHGARGIVTLVVQVGADGKAATVDTGTLDLRTCVRESLWSVTFPEELGPRVLLSIMVTP